MQVAALTINPSDTLAKFLLHVPKALCSMAKRSQFQRQECIYQETQNDSTKLKVKTAT